MSEINEVVETNDIVIKKGRGRPRKEIDNDVEIKPKGPKGRPRKEIDNTADLKPKGPKGRPKL